MKKLIAPLAALLLMGLVGCGAGGSSEAADSGQQSDSAAQQNAEPAAEELASDVKFGAPAGASHDGGQFAITASPLQDLTEFAVPPVEGKYVVVDVEAKLVGGTGGAVTAVDFMLVDAAGTEYPNAAPNGTDLDGVLFATLLTRGDSGSGKVFFDVPADASGLVLKYQPLGSTEPVAQWS
ncbi:DUF4352 domain-containing protein [Saccharopolyspora sp. 5N708]|uniref:DUF4352 domain-containing protein n=1 Tax=Saccharopolyspora sp. 5N708 TaxID=3457424 RepID=UPI003FD05920